MDTMTWALGIGFLVLILVAGAVAFAVAGRKKSGTEGDLVQHYVTASQLLTPVESEFYKLFLMIFEGSALVCPKVRLSDVVKPIGHRNKSEWQSAINKTARIQLGFACIRLDDLSLLGVIELVEPEQGDRAQRDAFVDRVLGGAGIPISRIPVSPEIDGDQVRTQLMQDFGLTAFEEEA